MTIERKLEWLLLALTAGLLISLKQSHYGVTHYNIFLVILLLWPLILVIAFKRLNSDNKQTNVGRQFHIGDAHTRLKRPDPEL